MIGMTFQATKGSFFDRDKVKRSVDAGTRRVFSKFGAFVRQRAKTSINKRKGTNRSCRILSCSPSTFGDNARWSCPVSALPITVFVMIAFACASCGKPLKVKDEFAGRSSACPQCKQPIVVPLPDATVAEPQVGDTPSSAEGERSALAFLAPKQRPDELGRLGSYRVLKVLGGGGMGVVLQAEDPALKRLVALKVMRPELAAKETNRQRFLREAQTTAAVEHSHIVPILHIGQEGPVPYIVLPFLKGEPLDERLKREPRLTVAEAVRIARQTAEGLTAAHEHGLIHRDIKPANLWLEAKTGVVKILDFGLARGLADDTHLTQSGAIVGTPAYMAPEQARGEKVDARCDLYSLGVVLYRMCTGDMPFKGKGTLSLLSALALDTPTEPR